MNVELHITKKDRWEDYAACREADAEVFFPTRKASPDEARAKQVCGGCQVQRQCLNWAMETRQDDGVIGGLSAAERRALHRRWNRPVASNGRTTRADQLVADPTELLKLLGSGLTPYEVATRLRTNVATINKVQRILALPAAASALNAAGASL